MKEASIQADVKLRSECPIAATLDIVGDKWSLLLIRDIGLFDKHRNKDFQEGAEGFPTNILADRLRRLLAAGLIEKRPYQTNPPRYDYNLTEAGTGLLPVIRAMAQWADIYVEGVRIPDTLKQHRG